MLMYMGAAHAQDSFAEEFIRLMNEKRASGYTCPEIVYSNGAPDPAIPLAPSPPLSRNTQLDAAAQAYLGEVDKLTAGPQDEPRFIGPSGYLPWWSYFGYDFVRLETPTSKPDAVAAVAAALTGLTCRAVLSGNYSEFGFAALNRTGGVRWGIFVAEPFKPEKKREYAEKIFNVINERRAHGSITCPYTTNEVSAKPLFIWDDGLTGTCRTTA